jgi:hypothetical protein
MSEDQALNKEWHMELPVESKPDRLRRYLAEDSTWARFDNLETVPQGWMFVEHPDGGIAAWRKPPRWILTQPPGDRIRPRSRGGLYKPQ